MGNRTEILMTRRDTDVGVGEFDSIAWLFESIVKREDDTAILSALVTNEDCPERIAFYAEAEPLITSVPVRVWTDEEGREDFISEEMANDIDAGGDPATSRAYAESAWDREQAAKRLASLAPGYNQDLAISQGWIMANNDGRLEMQRFDCDPAQRFLSDSLALAFVEHLAAEDQWSHAGMCLRYVTEENQKRGIA